MREIGNAQLQVLKTKQELRLAEVLRSKNHFNERLPYDIDKENSEIDRVFTSNHFQMNSDEDSQEIIIVCQNDDETMQKFDEYASSDGGSFAEATVR